MVVADATAKDKRENKRIKDISKHIEEQTKGIKDEQEDRQIRYKKEAIRGKKY